MVRWARAKLRIVATAVGLASCVATPACDEQKEDPSSAESLPPLKLNDATPNLLLTWIDERGGTHTGVSIAEVPQGSRAMVRVIREQLGHGQVFYVADLTTKDDQGFYEVKSMPRTAWEAEIEKRRAAYRARTAPAPRASGEPPAAVNQVQVIIYGASWCKPCHDAAAYLRRKGVPVTEYDIEKEPTRAREMMRKLRDAGMGGNSIPVIDVGGTLLKGYSPGALDRALAKAARSGTRL